MVTDGAGQPPTELGSFAADYTLDDLLHWAEGVLGSAVTWVDRSEQHTASLVLELLDDAGRRWFLKYPRDRDRFDREVAAFVTVLPSFGDQVPQLAGYDSRLQCLLISAVPGRNARVGALAKDPDVHRAAGAWLAELHAIEVDEPTEVPVAWTRQQVQSVVDRSENLLAPSELEVLRQSVGLLEPAGVSVVPCHGDFMPRNWLVDDDGLRVIDFGQSGHDHAIRDLGRLALRTWKGNPDLREAFLDGYGRRLEPEEQRYLDGFVVMLVAQNIVREVNRNDLRAVKRWRRVLAGLIASSA